MKLYCLLLLLLLIVPAGAAALDDNQSDTNDNESDSDTIICASGFLPRQTSQVISADRINDGYCDCPLDGRDEPHTEACSGSLVGGWAGITGSPETVEGLRVSCGPRQPNLLLPVSRIHDGICDCCDGSDEDSFSMRKNQQQQQQQQQCPNTCDQILKEQRQQRRQLEEHFKKGRARRLEELAKFQTVVQETERELDSVMTELSNNLTPALLQVENEIQTFKLGALKQRRQIVQETIAALDSPSSDLTGLLTSLSEDELVTIIVQACQLAGEQEENAKNDYSSSWSTTTTMTCVPLRWMGVNAGLVWGEEDFQAGTVSLERLVDLESTTILWADLVDRNAAGEAVWSVVHDDTKKERHHRRRRHDDEDTEEDHRRHSRIKDDKQNHRRLTQDEDWDRDDDYHLHHDDDDDYDHDDDEADYPYEEPDEYEHSPPVRSNKAAERNEELYDKIKSFPFSATRVTFLKESSAILDKINELTKEADENGEEEEEEEQETETRNETETPAVDPMALKMVTSTLQRRVEAIQRGLDYAVSATILVQSIQESRKEHLISLAAGTLYYGKIRSVDVWQMLAYMTVVDMPPAESCFSPFAVLCPPHVTERNGKPYPPPPIVKAAQQYCQAAQDADTNACAETSDGDGDIPGSIPDNYYGYTEAQPREREDALSQVFAPLASYGDRAPLVELLEKRNDLQEKQRSLTRKRKELEDKMGGRDHSKYGNQGELYSLRDTCHSVQEGKYIYEVCIFGRAQQKESDGASGTNLGKWHKMKVDPETGERTMEWTGGAKCWNGPERSATVHVTCGGEEKVLSAEEPDTCRYVLEMTSHIACDDNYKQRHAL